jgi:hypothetical protein
LYGCETWSFILREENKQNVPEQGAKENEVRRRQHNEELPNFYYSPHIIRVIKSRNIDGRACSTHKRDEKCIHTFVQIINREKTNRKT